MEQSLDNKAIRGTILRLIVPVALENMLQILASMINMAMVGRLLVTDISAQGLSNRIYGICFVLFRGLGIGATLHIAFYYGKGALSSCRRVTEQTYLTVLPISLLLALSCTIFSRQFIGLLTDNPVLLETASRYLRIAIWSIPFMTVLTINTAAFNGQNDTKTPMYIAILLNILNVGVSYAAIFGISSVEGFGITGAAIATITSQFFGAALGLCLLYKKNGILRAANHEKPFFTLELPDVKSVYSTGIPAAFEHVLWHVSALLVTKVILNYGSDVYAAYQLGLQAELVVERLAMGFTVAAATLTAQAIAKRDDNLFRAYYKNLVRLSLIMGLCSTLFMLITSKLFMSFLTDKPVLREIGTVYLIFMAFTQVQQVLFKTYNGIIRATGSKRVPMYIVFTGIWLVRVPLIMLVGWYFMWNIVWIWLVISLDQTTEVLLSFAYVKHKKLADFVERMHSNKQETKLASFRST